MLGIPRSEPEPLISVVMTVYDPDPVVFGKAVHSIRVQSLRDWELIVIEDPSNRSAAPTLRDIPDLRIRYFANPRRTSLVAQKNLGLGKARGDFVALMDADDIAHPFRFAKQVSFLRSHPEVDVVGSQIGVIDSEDRLAGYRWYPATHLEIQHMMPRYVSIHQPTAMLRREVIDRLGGYRFVEFPAAEDYEFWSRLIQEGVQFANLPEVLYYYRIHPSQIKLAKLRETIGGVLRVKELYWERQFDLPSRIRMWAERLLPYVPRRVVVWMLLRGRWHYRPGPARPSVWPCVHSRIVSGAAR